MRKAVRRLSRKTKTFTRRAARFCLRRVFFPMVYRLACAARKIDPKLIFFVNKGERAPGDNFRPLMERLTAQGYRCVHVGKMEGGRLRQYLEILRFNWDYARARMVFLSEVCPLVDSVRPRKGTEIVQLWHGCGAFKKWGYSTVDLSWGSSAATLKWFPAYRYQTWCSVSSPEVIPHYAQAFNCGEDIIRPWGVPRTDFYFRPGVAEDCHRKVLEAFPAIGQRKIVLYAPTFRGNSLRRARHDDVLEYHALAEALGERCALLLKPHPQARRSIPAPEPGQTPFVFDAADQPIEVLLCAADLVISDYSSLIFEYALLGRPMLFYAYDLERYEKSRSFYYPYLQFVPGDLVWDTDDMINGIRHNLFEGGFEPARVQAFREKFMCACDGHSTERILKHVLGI